MVTSLLGRELGRASLFSHPSLFGNSLLFAGGGRWGASGRAWPPKPPSGRGAGRPPPSHTTGHAGHASGGSSGMPQSPAMTKSEQAEFRPVPVRQGTTQGRGVGEHPGAF